MHGKKHFVAIIGLMILLALTSVALAQYDHVITDAEDDVDYWDGQTWIYNVERPDIDIIRVEISEGGEGVIVSLTVKGTITDAPNINYGILMVDGEGGDYGIHYTDGECSLYVDASEGQLVYEPETSGAGTSTLSVDIALEDIFEPDSLEISEVWTYEYIDQENEYYWDTADPDDDNDVTDPNDDNDVTDPDDDPIFDDDDLPEFIEDWFERGMMCLALGVIIVVVIVIIIIVVIIKLVKKNGKDQEQPPRQEYRQPPPPTEPPQPEEMKYQQKPPTEDYEITDTDGDMLDPDK